MSDLSCSSIALSHCWLILPLIGVVYLREIIVALVVVIDSFYCWFILSMISVVVMWMITVALVVVTSPRFIDLRVVTSLLAVWTEIRILVSCRRVWSLELPRIFIYSM